MHSRLFCIAFIATTILLTGCNTTGSVLSSTNTGATVTMTGALSVVQSTVQNIRDAGTIAVQKIQSLQKNMQNRVEKIQKGAKKIQNGKEMIEDGLL